MTESVKNLQIAVIIPCYNEEHTVKQVIKDFKASLPKARICVFDNNSTDKTNEVARKAGAEVYEVNLKGKGNVVRRMFADIDADVYIMVDGDATYDAQSAPKLVETLLRSNFDMVVGCRTEVTTENGNYRPGHRLGNKLLTGSVQRMFNGNFTDMLSGYRAFSRRFVKSFSAESNGFEIETELTVYTLELRLPYGEVATPYSERPEGSESKLSTYKDGIRILTMIFRLYATERPRDFWAIISAILLFAAVLIIIPIIIEFNQTGTVPRFPSFILATTLAIGGFLALSIGLILRTVTKGRREMKHLAYLSIPSAQSATGLYEKNNN